MTEISLDLDSLDFAKGNGLVTVIAQDVTTAMVLMVAHADRDALERTIATGQMHYRSRTRGLWHKGATSGNVQQVISLSTDCDRDAVLAVVRPAGPACHTGSMSCFDASRAGALTRLAATISERAAITESAAADATSYTRRLLADRNLRLKKLGEESAELVLALADEDRERAVEEAADLLYHTLVALKSVGAELGDVQRLLDRRAQPRVSQPETAG
jgi:phosphoribosyl-ATP pyrophosphohydrolase/phosphoribosyl-AMP cyclohydrolase